MTTGNVTVVAPADADADDWAMTCETAEAAFADACSAALGVALERGSPLLSALTTGRQVMVLMYSGGDRGADGMPAFAWGRGWATASYDPLLDERHGNLLRSAVLDPLLAAARAGWIGAVWAGVPCESFTCLRFVEPGEGEPEAPPLRSRAYLPDLPPCPEGWQGYRDMHERFVDAAFDVMCAVRVAGGRAVAENPIDRGDVRRVAVYREEYADHAPLELHPRAQAFLASGGQVVDMAQCMSRGLFQKWTSLICDERTAAVLEPVQRAPCVHVRGDHAMQAKGLDHQGVSRSKRAAAYPRHMNWWAATALTGGSHSEVYAIMAETIQPILEPAIARAEAEGDARTAALGRGVAAAFARLEPPALQADE